jgi:drug/metabolite transporter (DMT)-like permease
MQKQVRAGYTLTALAAISWASTGPGIKYLLDTYHVPELTVAFWRDACIAIVCLLVHRVFSPSLLQVNRRELRAFALTGAVAIGIYHALWVLSIALNGAAVAIVLIYTFPTFVTLGSWLFFRERLHWQQVLALAVSLVGCVLLVRAYDPAVLQVSWLGILVGLGTGLTHAIYVLFSQHSVQSRSPWTSLTYTMLFGSLTLLLMSLIIRPADIVAVGTAPEPWLLLLALGLGPTLGGYAFFTMALRFIPASRASLVSILEAPVGALLSLLLLREHLELAQIIGIALILGAIVLPSLIARFQPVARSQAQRADESAVTLG